MEKEIKLHRNLCEATVEALVSTFIEGKYADKAIEKILKKDPRWGSRDRGFIAEQTYEIVRHYRYLASLCQLEQAETSDQFWTLLGCHLQLKNIALPPWKEWTNRPWLPLNEKIAAPKSRAVLQSVPDWLDELGMLELPDRWEKEMDVLNTPAEVILRVNTLKAKLGRAKAELEKENIFTEILPSYDSALQLTKRSNIFKSKAFLSGMVEVQDASSQLVGPYLRVEPGMRVIDACAGAGGKTLHLAALMQNKGQILSLDVEEWKLNNLKSRARRAGASIIETRLIENSKTIKRLESSADRLLLDVPCSGLGVLRRNPDAKWKLKPAFIAELKKTQLEILSSYSAMLKPGGLMVYATCSIMPGENLKQVETFLKENSGFELISENTIWPTENGFDGFYLSLIKRK